MEKLSCPRLQFQTDGGKDSSSSLPLVPGHYPIYPPTSWGKALDLSCQQEAIALPSM